MKPVSIANLEVKDHVRWANDQIALAECQVFNEARDVASHPELLGHSSNYPSQWESLVGWDKRQQPFAHFEPPASYARASRRLFSFRLLPHMDFPPKTDEEEVSPMIARIIELSCFKKYPRGVFEKEKTAILGMLHSIEFINILLEKISALKLKYQKG